MWSDALFTGDEECNCTKCRLCELDRAISMERTDPTLLTQWVRKWELSRPKYRKVKFAEPERAPGVLPPKAEMPPGAVSAYELTLTTVGDHPNELRDYLAKVIKSTVFDVVDWEACIELTEAGLPHIHAILYSRKKYVDASKIKAPKGPIKFPWRYELARVKNLDNYLNYIHKENGNPVIKAYCEKHNIPQFWDGKPKVTEEPKEQKPQDQKE